MLLSDDPCILTDCNSTIGERCVVVSQGTDSESDNDNKMPVCTCNYPCPEKVDPVCASNNRQYDNECLMEKSMCSNSVILSVKYHGPCYGYSFVALIITIYWLMWLFTVDPCVDVHCEQGQHCVSDYHTRRATCECISTCNSAEDSDIVCGSNGKWYPSFCWMNFAACKTNMTLSVEHRNSKEICGNGKQLLSITVSQLLQMLKSVFVLCVQLSQDRVLTLSLNLMVYAKIIVQWMTNVTAR